MTYSVAVYCNMAPASLETVADRFTLMHPRLVPMSPAKSGSVEQNRPRHSHYTHSQAHKQCRPRARVQHYLRSVGEPQLDLLIPAFICQHTGPRTALLKLARRYEIKSGYICLGTWAVLDSARNTHRRDWSINQMCKSMLPSWHVYRKMPGEPPVLQGLRKIFYWITRPLQLNHRQPFD